MGKVTIAQFATDGGYNLMKERSIPTRPVVLSQKELAKIQKKIIAKICQYAPKRPRPGGALSHPSMWSVRPRVLQGGEKPAFGFEVFAIREEPLESQSMFRSHDTTRSVKNARYHYAWWVEFGHNVKRPKVRLPFIEQSGRIWKVQVGGFTVRRGHVGRKSYREAKRPVWTDYGDFRPEKREMASVIPQFRRGKFANGRQYWVRTNQIKWLIPGSRVSHVPGVFFVKKALDEMSDEIWQTIYNAYFDTAKLAGMHPSTIEMYKRQKPIAIVNEDHYKNEAYLKTRITAPGMYSIVIKRGGV